MIRHAAFLPGLLALLLSGCAGGLSWDPPPERALHNQGAAPEAEPLPERPVGPTDHLVKKGDTVYSIAFRNQLDYRELARWNGVGADYLIRPGQVLHLRPPPRIEIVTDDIVSTPVDVDSISADAVIPGATPVPVAVAPVPLPPPPGIPAAPADRPPGTGPGRAGMVAGAAAGTAATAATAAAGSLASGTAAATAAAGASAAQVSLPPPRSPAVVTFEPGGPYKWQWPTDGVVVRGYAPAQGSKGLDFSGQVGQPVRAAAPGRVVYSGSALKGYGELIIIKHDDLRLSAYGYNRRRLVKEGDSVAGGQVIAELGIGPENKPILHFEIRERGKPVNPVSYLPPKS
ncbi:MAG TPA: peptidoglycan DD-metalloendopeptidase family protein [Nevskiaceae bacterium]|nr:peptidoglycan DD-metalloendopeptidase family protein [Nevskiaceae bacterium]